MELIAYEIKYASFLSRTHVKSVHFIVGLPVLSKIYFLQKVDSWNCACSQFYICCKRGLHNFA